MGSFVAQEEVSAGYWWSKEKPLEIAHVWRARDFSMSYLSTDLRTFTKQRQWPTTSLSDAMQRDLTFVRRCLRGEKNPSLETLILWARALDISHQHYLENRADTMHQLRKDRGMPTLLPRLVAAALKDAAISLRAD